MSNQATGPKFKVGDYVIILNSPDKIATGSGRGKVLAYNPKAIKMPYLVEIWPGYSWYYNEENLRFCIMTINKNKIKNWLNEN